MLYRMPALLLLGALMGTSLLPVPASAQGTGTIRGTVYDSSQAALPAATVVVTNTDTGFVRRSVSSADGIYSISALPPGPYRVEVEAQGFKRWSGTLELQTGETAVVDAVMQVGSVDTVVEVTGAAPVITTESSEVGDVKDALRIRQLPLDGRNISSLFTLTPGVEGGGNPRVNGMKVGATEMLLDGVSLVDRFGGGIARVQPGLDAVNEFRIETAGSQAQYSRPATVTLVTKSGTNQFHGSLFETHRNNAGGLRARQRQDGNQAPKLIRNEFGVSAGGPVMLPKLYDGRDKTFWFFAYEGLRQRQQQYYRQAVPTLDMWNGNFDNVVDAQGRKITIYDPLTTDAQGRRQPFLGNLIPENRISPFYKQIRAITPAPTNSINPLVGENFEAIYPVTDDVFKITARGDHRLSDKDTLMGRLTITDRSYAQAGGRFSAPPVDMQNPYGSGRQDFRFYSASTQYTRMFSPTVLNELTLGFQRSVNSNGTLADPVNWANQLGLPNPFGANGWPTLDAGDFYWDADNRKDEALTGYVIEDNLTWVTGKHTFKMGGKVRYEQNNVRELQQAQGSHGFNGNWTSLYDPATDQIVPFTGFSMASMALGLPANLTNQNNRGFFYFRQWELGLYFQDTWKVTPRLTLDLGVRWDRWSPYSEKLNRFVNINPATVGSTFQVVTPGNVPMEQIPGVLPSQLASWAARGLTWTTAEQAGLPSNHVRADNNNFGPRIGVAYKLTDKSVLRASYGEYFWTMPLSQILQSMRLTPPLNLRYENPVGQVDGTATYAARVVPSANSYIGQAIVNTDGLVRIPPAAQTGLLLDGRNWRDGRAQKWHLTYERQFLRDSAVRLSYMGDHGRDLEQRYSINQPEAQYNYVLRTGQNPPGNRDFMRENPNWNLSATNRTGYSNTHQLQAEFEKRYSSGVQFQIFYTFSRALTTSDADGFTSGNGAINAIGTGVAQVPAANQVLGAPQMSYDDLLRLVYYNSGYVPPHRVRWNGVYDLPFGKGRRFGGSSSGFVNAVIGGWQLSTIGDWRSGNWMGVAANRYLFGDPTLDADERLLLNFGGRPQRLWFRGDFDVTAATGVDQAKLQALIPVDRSQRVLRQVGPNLDNRLPVQLADGTTRLTTIEDAVNWNARNFFRGPGSWNTDISISKFFRINEGMNLQFSADFFNAFNHPVDVNPNTTTGLQDLSQQANPPRVIQLRARFTW
jgi:PEGA domain.